MSTPQIIGPNSSVKLGWVISLAITLSGAVWFAAISTEKLNVLIKGQSEMGAQMMRFDTGISDLRDRVKSLELYGSPVNNTRLDAHDVALSDRDKADVELRTRIEKLADAFRVHATQKDPLTFPPSGGRKEGDLW